MYVVTFYSYKGGTGRSMALVNVAAALARSGRNVLVVDFDLEAPGLDTFNLPRPLESGSMKGLVEFIDEYVKSGIAPDVSDFVYKSSISSASGQLWIMPAGNPGTEYDQKFKSVNWQDLYDNHDGYLFFEDLKAQWKQTLSPDYVLIDSRTGHTDVGGICTRQLPDAVVLFFFPNEQNRRGLETIVKQVRAEATSERQKQIKLHFVLSNVPELDDEEGFLANNVARFRESLGFRQFAAVVHHYNSLALLTQSIFTLDRPKTRLAHEYGLLAKAIRRDNVEDRDAALEFLDEVAPLPRRPRIPASQLEERIKAIKTKHPDDPEVLTRLGVLFRRERRFDEALSIFEQAAELGVRNAELSLATAELHLQLGKPELALRNVEELLKSTDPTYLEFTAAARLFLKLDPKRARTLMSSPAFGQLDPEGQHYLATELFDSRQGMALAADILSALWDKSDSAFARVIDVDFALSLISSGQFERAIRVISNEGRKSLADLEISDAFNYAMAKWAIDSKPSPELFGRVVDLDKSRRSAGPNFHQCLAIAFWVLDRQEDALSRVGEAWQQMMTRNSPDFSSWSYLRLPPDAFLEDLKQLQQLFEGEQLVPRFFPGAHKSRYEENG